MNKVKIKFVKKEKKSNDTSSEAITDDEFFCKWNKIRVDKVELSRLESSNTITEISY